MRILMVTDWNRGQGGAEAYIGWLRAGLRNAGEQVQLLTSSAGSAAGGTAEHVAFGTERVIAQAFLQIANPFATRAVRRAVNSFRPELVFINMFAHHLSPAIFQAVGDLPIVLAVSDYKCVCPIGSKLLPNGIICTDQAGWVCCKGGCVSVPHWLRDQPRYALLRLGIARAVKVLACSEWMRQELELAGIQSSVLELPVPAPGPGFVRQKSLHPTFFFSGRLDREKGVEHLLRAFAMVLTRHPQATLRVAGKGPERIHLEQVSRDLSLDGHVHFLGWLEPPDIERELSIAWALVAPSLWAEPLGLVALEGIVRGVPVVATASGGFAETVSEGITGLLVPNGDIKALAGALEKVAAGMFADGIAREVVEEFRKRCDMEAHIADVRRVFGEAVVSRGSGELPT